MTANTKIRRMTLSDIQDVMRIERQSFQTPWEETSFITDITTNRCARYLVLEIFGKVAAYAGMWIVLNEAHITNIAVSPDYRGNHYGKQITEALMTLASNLGVSWMTLEVRVKNDIARKMYESLGFTPVGVRKGYYSDTGEDAILMVCENLPPPDPDFYGDEAIVRE